MILVLRETHDPPETVARVLELAGGRNRLGEPNYRAVWGWNRLAWIGGKFEDRDEHGALLRERVELRREPKYPQVNRCTSNGGFHQKRMVRHAIGIRKRLNMPTAGVSRHSGRILRAAITNIASHWKRRVANLFSSPQRLPNTSRARSNVHAAHVQNILARTPGPNCTKGKHAKTAPTPTGLTTCSMTPSRHSTSSLL